MFIKNIYIILQSYISTFNIISASLYERSAYATGVSRGPSVCPHM